MIEDAVLRELTSLQRSRFCIPFTLSLSQPF